MENIMDSSVIVQFMLSLGVDDSSIIVDDDRQWVRCSCPFASWTHKSGKDSHPSFGISIREDSEETQSVANCQTCGRYSGDRNHWKIEDIIHKMWLLSGEYPKAAAQIYTTGRKYAETEVLQIKERPDEFKEPPKPFPLRMLQKYPKLKNRKPEHIQALSIMDYMDFKRGLSEDLLYYFNVRYNSTANTIIFPLTGLDGNTYAMRERECSYTRKKIWTVNNTILKRDHRMTDIVFPKITESGAMFGLAQFDTGKNTATLCEGEIDTMSLKKFGAINPLGSATNQITTAQFKAIAPYIDKLIHVPDADKAGVESVLKVKKFFSNTDVEIITLDCGLVEVTDPVTLTKKKAKDAGDLKTKEQYQYLLANPKTQDEFIKKYH